MEKKTSWIKISLFVLLGLIIATLAAFFAYVYSWNNTYIGVKCGGVSLSGMTSDEVVENLRGLVPEDYSQKEIEMSFDGKEEKVLLSDFGVKYDLSQTAEDALKYGREGGFFKRAKEVISALFTGYDLKACFAYDAAALEGKVEEMLQNVGTPVIESTYEINNGKFYIINGKSGNMPDGEFVLNEIVRAVGDFSDEKLVFEKEVRKPKDIDVEELCKELGGEAQDASYVYEGGNVTVVPHRYNVVFDKGQAKKIIAENQEEGKKYEIPATVEEPKFLEKDAKARLFSQTIGSYKSNYNQGDVSRSSNVALAAKLINGTILMPGDEFSYNGVVGKRTAEAGFKVAHVYINNEVADGIGGGICQVSSTLYCAVLYANLEVTERVNHQLPVSYVPLGQDATVDYGNIDFRFKNNTGYPLRILAHASGGVMYASIEGYKDTNETVEILPVMIATIPPRVVEEKDPTLPMGERKEGEAGSSGSIVETYKIVTVNGESKKTRISKSTYASGKTIVKVGTGENVLPGTGTVNPQDVVINIPADAQMPVPQSVPAPQQNVPPVPETPQAEPSSEGAGEEAGSVQPESVQPDPAALQE